MADNQNSNLDDLLAEIAGSKPATAASHLSYVMGVFEKADAKIEVTPEDTVEKHSER